MISECFMEHPNETWYFPVMLGEYWVYVLAGIISITTLILLYSHN
jgi:hypothetical protein